MQYSIVWMIRNFSATTKLSEKKYVSTKFTVYYLENYDTKKLIFVRSCDSCFLVKTIEKLVILERSAKLKNSKQNIFLKWTVFLLSKG
jgi:hypothetical protein